MVDACVDRLEIAALVVRLLHRAREDSTRLHRLLHVDGCAERLVVDDDGLGSVLGCRLGLGNDERDGLTGEDHLLARERLRGAVGAGRRDREVGSGEHGDDTGNREGSLLVDATDSRVSLGREHGSRVQQAVDVAVGGEVRRAGHLVRRVDARPRDADQRVAHASSFARSRAAASARSATTCASSRRYSSDAKRSP